VIPEVVKVILDKRPKGTDYYKLPEYCPVCNHQVRRLEDEAVARCQNMACPAQIKGRIQHFISKNCMDIDGFGEKLVDQLVEKGHIMSVADIFKITHDQLASLERMGEKSATNVISAINVAKATTFARFIHSLGIRNVGEHSGKVLERAFSGNLEKLTSTTVTDLIRIHEIGEVMAQSIVDFFADPTNLYLVQSCLDSGVSFERVEEIKASGITEKIFVFTGSLLKFTRKEAQGMVEKLGARASGSVSKKTDFVVAGPGAGSKLDSANLLKIDVLTEEEFLKMMKELEK
jgi:DNA ligase (NAD+)